MKTIMKIFKFFFCKADGEFSWRKVLAATVAFVFGFASIGFLFGLKILPDKYIYTIDLVFLFYFGKDVLNNVKLVSKN